MNSNYKRVKIACYATSITTSVCGNISPLLFLSFRSLYGISYSLLGMLVLINFFTQLIIDLIYSFFSEKLNPERSVKLTPAIAAIGFLVYAGWPLIFPETAYVGIVIGTVIYSAASGLAEVLLSPVIAAMPSDDPEREMSKLHSVYAWGVVGIVLFSTAFIFLVGMEYWNYLIFILTLIPALALVLFLGADLPKLETGERAEGGGLIHLKSRTLWICVLAIFFGGAAECTMAQWSSGYIEAALGLPKIFGDVFGVAMFALMLGLGRTLYAKRGKNVEKVLLVSGIGAAVCYLVAALSPYPIIGLIACALTGLCTAMMWPGSLIAVAERIPAGGVFMYAMMASGGDLGASVAPQLVGIITDGVAASPFFSDIAANLGINAEQLGMKCGMLVGMLFPLAAIFVYSYLVREKKRRSADSVKLSR